MTNTFPAITLCLSLVACASSHQERPAAPGGEPASADSTYRRVRTSWLEGRGYRQDAEGDFLSGPARRAAAAGWISIDADFVDPATRPDRPDGGAELFPCGDLWLELDDADDCHSRLLRWWKLESDSFRTYSTCQRSTALIALEWMDHVEPVLERIFGRSPRVKPTVILLRNQEQYNAFAVTQGEIGELPSDSVGYAAFHYAFPCDRWLDRDADYEHPGAAGAYWDDRTSAGNGWGPYAVRHAAAQAFIESLDPSPVSIGSFKEAPLGPFPSESFWSEKRLPLWLRYGVAVYCERFLLNPASEPPDEVRRWSLGELDAMGGPVEVHALFEFDLDPKDPEGAARLLLSAGAMVAYLVDEEPELNAAARQALIESVADDATPEKSAALIRQIEATLAGRSE